MSSRDVPIDWHDRTNHVVFTWQEPHRRGGKVSYEDRKSTWNSGVVEDDENVIHGFAPARGTDRVTGTWKQISKHKRRVSVSYYPSTLTAL